jgi:hypothetical protein
VPSCAGGACGPLLGHAHAADLQQEEIVERT